MPRERHRRKKRRLGLRRAALATCAAVAVPLLAWSAYAFVSNDHPSTTHPGNSSPSSTVQTPNPTSTPPDEASEAQDVIAGCAERVAAAEAVVAEAAVSVGHWTEHVKARTDLLTGVITQAETKAIWKRTKLAGPDDLVRFNSTITAYNAAAGCGQVKADTAPENLVAAAKACLARVESGDAAVNVAAAAVGDWEAHLNAMAAHAKGEMTADEAQYLWVEAWRKAPTNIEAFDNARDALSQAPACAGATS